MSSDDQFTALGEPSGTPIGFQTNASHIAVGADIFGNDAGGIFKSGTGVGLTGISEQSFGILGESQNKEGIRGTSDTLAGVEGISGTTMGVSGSGAPGVFGQLATALGQPAGHNGVMGVVDGTGGAGVFGGHRTVTSPALNLSESLTTFGEAESPGAGVVGIAVGDGNGVVGHSNEGHGVVGTSSGGVEFKNHGVFARSEKTAGVVGISGGPNAATTSQSLVPSGHAGVFGFCASGTGVFGSSSTENGARGHSVDGDGVLGQSTNGRGGVFQSTTERAGVFESGKVAQVNLRPLLAQPSLPCEGKAGDFLVVSLLKNEGDTDPLPEGLASVWFCVRASTPERGPAVWLRMNFDLVRTCNDGPVPVPPQNHPKE